MKNKLYHFSESHKNVCADTVSAKRRHLIYKAVVSMCAVFMCVVALFCTEASAGEIKYVTGASTGAVYLRKAPASSSYYTIVYNGSSVESIGWERGWDGEGYNQVVYNGQSGWIKSCYLTSYYSSYTMACRIQGASSGAVYRWKSYYGNDYYGTVPVGATVYISPGSYSNGRVYGTYKGAGGWFTATFVYPN